MTIYPINECTISIKVGDGLDEVVSEKVHALYRQLKQNPFWSDVVPAYNTVTVVYNPLALLQHYPLASAYAVSLLQQAIDQPIIETRQSNRLLKIPVCYDTTFGLDLTQMSRDLKISVDEIIMLHTAEMYRGYMIGFLPGFAYMGKVDPRIVSPRLAKPRTLVPAGSVGIAGEQTGIYPLDSPGGWNVVGRTPLKLFDAKKSDPVFFRPGDQVKFVQISTQEFREFDSAIFFQNYEP